MNSVFSWCCGKYRNWPGGDCLACRWPVLIQYHLQTPCATSSTVACATQWVLLIVSGVYRRRKMRASHPGSQMGGRKAERCMFYCAQWHWRTSTSSPLMVEVAPVTSITPTVECPTFSQAQQLLRFFFLSHLRQTRFFFVHFNGSCFLRIEKAWFLKCCIIFILMSVVLFLVFLLLNHKHPYKLSFFKVPSAKPACLCDFVPLFHTRVHADAFCHCFMHNNI